MIIFKIRTKKPETNNKYYISKSTPNSDNIKGYNPCSLGNEKRRDKYLNVLPNCVGYATGRFNEIGEYDCIKYALRGNAENFINDAKRIGLKTQKSPTIGGILVWSGGSSGKGHVAIVEDIQPDGTVITSESLWDGQVFIVYGRYGENYSSGCPWMKSNLYKYEGCVINPAVEEKMDYEQFKKYMDLYIKEMSEKECSEWSKSSVDRMVTLGVTDGKRPGMYSTREEVITMLSNLIGGGE